MPRSWERRTIDFFIRQYNLDQDPKIVSRQADPAQEAPDAICKLEDGRNIALELTSVYPPKGASKRRTKQNLHDLSPIRRCVERKLLNDYHIPDVDEVWLVIQIRNTLSSQKIISTLGEYQLERINQLFVLWPTPIGDHEIRNGIYTLPQGNLRILDRVS